ncbi:DUF3006 domain-containing protein [Porcipelethomonas sp.]|uniref:DUF3006 domain-containing protein n=1 Tax=Porcipelethomonas sp. TaxID=2981675 RepID=UPI003EF6ACA1
MLIIERFEGNIAVIEDDDNHLEIDRNSLPDNAREGDVLVKSGDAYKIDPEQTKKRREKILKLQNSLWS